MRILELPRDCRLRVAGVQAIPDRLHYLLALCDREALEEHRIAAAEAVERLCAAVLHAHGEWPRRLLSDEGHRADTAARLARARAAGFRPVDPGMDAHEAAGHLLDARTGTDVWYSFTSRRSQCWANLELYVPRARGHWVVKVAMHIKVTRVVFEADLPACFREHVVRFATAISHGRDLTVRDPYRRDLLR
jgi:hypothetical protein